MNIVNMKDKVVNKVSDFYNITKEIWIQADTTFKVCVSIIACIALLEIVFLNISFITSVLFLMFLFTLECQKMVISDQDATIEHYKNSIAENNSKCVDEQSNSTK